MPASFPALAFPKLERATLPNGMKVILAERRGLPIVEMTLDIEGAGTVSDQAPRVGLANFAMGMLDEGAASYSALALGDKLESLGARLATYAERDSAVITLATLTATLEPSLGVLADVVLRPTIDAKELEHVRATSIAGIRQERSTRTRSRRAWGPGYCSARDTCTPRRRAAPKHRSQR
jgi:predicted Zn-dependent peptidase